MSVFRHVLVFALVPLALVALSSAPLGANALVADRLEVARHPRAHDALARRKRSDSSSATGRCIPRPSSAPPVPSSAPPTLSTTTSSAPPAPSATSSPTYVSSSVAPNVTTSANSSSSLNNMCLAWGGGYNTQDFQKFSFNTIRYWYDWDAYVPNNLLDGWTGMSMLWGEKNVAAFSQFVQNNKVKIVLGPNEPNEPSQSNMSPGDAFNLWMTYIVPLRKEGVTLISPACTNSPSGLDWIQEFMNLCKGTEGSTPDAVAYHGYTPDADKLINFAIELYKNFGLPVVLSEFACQDFTVSNYNPSPSDIWAFAVKVKAFIRSTSWLMMACPFGTVTDMQNVNKLNSLMNEDGTPTPLANYYFS